VITEQAIIEQPQDSAEGIDQSVEQRHHRQLGAISGTQLVFGVHHVGLHRYRRDAEAAADALVGEAASDACHHLQFPLGELFNQRRQVRVRSLSRTELANLFGEIHPAFREGLEGLHEITLTGAEA